MKLYVGTCKKYNSGSTYGNWMDLDDFSSVDKFLVACRELHQDEEEPEFLFLNCEVDHPWEKALYSKSSVPLEYWEIKRELMTQAFDDDVFSAFLSTKEGEAASVELVNDCQASYIGTFQSLADYAENLCWETGLLQGVSDVLIGFIDFEEMGRRWERSGEIDYINGYVFQR